MSAGTGDPALPAVASAVSAVAGPAASPPFTPVAWPGLTALAEHPWAYPALEAVHILGIAGFLGSLVMVDLRLWGAGAALPLRPLAALALKVGAGGFALVVASGLLMFATQPGEMLAHRAFVLKMALLMLAGLNAAAFHARDGLGRADAVARAQSLLSVALWIAVLGAGRWIAYG